ncbi:hypothetical protein [Pollutibacter soli]|uniref:hypothetical protein n=1 Tax=Pollutibacter soli TaxID=3034157 RepID=UPI00301356CE
MRNLYLLILPVLLSSFSCSIKTDVAENELPVISSPDSLSLQASIIKETDRLTIREWIHRICETESPDPKVIAYNFGLIQIDNGYSLYLIGSKEYDVDNSEWAFNIDFEPRMKYYPLADTIYSKLSFDKVQTKINNELKEFTASVNFRNSFFANAKAITTGLADGNLVRIK